MKEIKKDDRIYFMELEENEVNTKRFLEKI